MSVNQATADGHETDYELGRGVRSGALLMALAGVAFIGYGVVFLARTFFGTGFELGVATLNGVTRADLNAMVMVTAWSPRTLVVRTFNR